MGPSNNFKMLNISFKDTWRQMKTIKCCTVPFYWIFERGTRTKLQNRHLKHSSSKGALFLDALSYRFFSEVKWTVPDFCLTLWELWQRFADNMFCGGFDLWGYVLWSKITAEYTFNNLFKKKTIKGENKLLFTPIVTSKYA